MRQFIDDILKHAPEIRCFAVGSDEIAIRNSQRAAKHQPRSKRKQSARKHYARWKRSLDKLTKNEEALSYDEMLSRLHSLPLDAIRTAHDAAAADALIDEVVIDIRVLPPGGTGIWEQFVTDEIVLIWLWNDR